MRSGKTVPVRKVLPVLLAVSFVFIFIVGLSNAQALDVTDDDLQMSYHGTLGHLLTADATDHEQGMLEKWCALPDLNIADDSFVGTMSWTARCGGCHIGGWFGALPVVIGEDSWNVDPAKPNVDCLSCHDTEAGDAPTIAKCMVCHAKEKAKRGLDLDNDVHMVGLGYTCQTCHVRLEDDDSNHQLAKGTCIDTTLETSWGTLSDEGKDCAGCHGQRPHRRAVKRGVKIDQHCDKVACETCHTGYRAAYALQSRSWAIGPYDSAPIDVKHGEAWLPVHKWYDGQGPSEAWPASGHLPILEPAEMKDNPGAKIYPFNDIEATWWIKDGSGGQPALDNVIQLSVVKGAYATCDDGLGDNVLTSAEKTCMEAEFAASGYPNATLWTEKVCFNVSHSVVPKEDAFTCNDCHRGNNSILDWEALGYAPEEIETLSSAE